MAAQTAAVDGATEIRDVHLKVDTRFANVKVVGEAGMETRDTNMPKNLHNAAELFLRAGLVANAEKLMETTNAMFKILSANPDGAAHSLGRGAVCWACGYTGLARDPEANAPVCGACGSDDANWLRVLKDETMEVPWIQAKTLTPEQAAQREKAAVAAKRAEVEAGVREALAARGEGGT